MKTLFPIFAVIALTIITGTVGQKESGIIFDSPLENIPEIENGNRLGPLPSINVTHVFDQLFKMIFDVVDPISLPFLPVISFKTGEAVDVAISLTDIYFTGLADVTVDKVDLPLSDNEFKIHMTFPQLRLTAQQYSAGGHILNLPFAGESFLYVSFENIVVEVSMNFSTFDIIPIGGYEFCIENGTTVYDQLEIGKSVIHFDDLNPGTDQGILINSIMDASIQDIADAVTWNFPNSIVDNFMVSTFNNLFCRPFHLPPRTEEQ